MKCQEVTSRASEGDCATCDDPLVEHPDEGMVRFEWAETARPDGYWYYREAGLQSESVLRRDHRWLGPVLSRCDHEEREHADDEFNGPTCYPCLVPDAPSVALHIYTEEAEMNERVFLSGRYNFGDAKRFRRSFCCGELAARFSDYNGTLFTKADELFFTVAEIEGGYSMGDYVTTEPVGPPLKFCPYCGSDSTMRIEEKALTVANAPDSARIPDTEETTP